MSLYSQVWSRSQPKAWPDLFQSEALLLELERGSEVAILPGPYAPPDTAEELATVERNNSELIELTDGRLYAINGKACSLASCGYIVPATDEHRMAVLEREFSR